MGAIEKGSKPRAEKFGHKMLMSTPTPNQVPKSVWINPPIKEIAKPEIIILNPFVSSVSNPLTCSEEAHSSDPRFPRQSM
jgi:hypothetical protein